MPGAGGGGRLNGPGGGDPGGPDPSPYARGCGPPSVTSVTSARQSWGRWGTGELPGERGRRCDGGQGAGEAGRVTASGALMRWVRAHLGVLSWS